MVGRNIIRYRPASVFHQLDAGNSTGDRQPIRLPHLGRGEELQMRPLREVHSCARWLLIVLAPTTDSDDG